MKCHGNVFGSCQYRHCYFSWQCFLQQGIIRLAQKVIFWGTAILLRKFYGRLFWCGPKHPYFLDGCTEKSSQILHQNLMGNTKHTWQLTWERQTFLNLFWVCFGFEFASFVPNTYFAERKPKSYNWCVSHWFGNTSNTKTKNHQ